MQIAYNIHRRGFQYFLKCMNQLLNKKENSFIPNAGSKRFENEQKMHEILVTREHGIS